jgi:hypothetical protein
MSPAAITLRLLLIVALILNGVGSAVASAKMAGAQAPAAVGAHPHHAMAQAHGEHVGCHEHANPSAGQDASPGPAGHGKHGTECCHSGTCACHCAQQAQVPFVPPVLASPQVAQAAGVRAMGSAHESPRLPHLIRPPICQAS